jgi:dTDP-glucose 4,6-dehydratase
LTVSPAGNLENLENIPAGQKKRFTFVKGDICDSNIVQDIFERDSVDRVVNYAAESHFDRSIHDPQVFLRSNILGMANLLDTARRSWKEGSEWLPEKKFLEVLTDEVYGSLGADDILLRLRRLTPTAPIQTARLLRIFSQRRIMIPMGCRSSLPSVLIITDLTSFRKN